MDALFCNAINMWWEKIPPTHPCFVLMKNKKEMALEIKKIKVWTWQALKYLFYFI